jgi:hypothetical protein
MSEARRARSIVGGVAVAGAAFLLVVAGVAQPWGEPSSTDADRTTDEPVVPFHPAPEPWWLGAGAENVVGPAVLEGKPRVCARYAEVAGRVVNGWYLSAFDRIGYGSPVGTFVHSRPVPERGIAWRCTSSGLHLELHLPADDARHQHADDALADILSALPWNGLDPTADELRIVVTLGETGDVATFDPAKG